MKKHRVVCPVCGVRFDPLAPQVHINRYHQSVTCRELVLIRDARRQCFGKSKPVKNKSPLLTRTHR